MKRVAFEKYMLQLLQQRRNLHRFLAKRTFYAGFDNFGIQTVVILVDGAETCVAEKTSVWLLRVLHHHKGYFSFAVL